MDRPAEPEKALNLERLGYAEPLLRLDVSQWENGRSTAKKEPVIEETAVAFGYNQIPYVVMMATPADLGDFALGLSLAEGILRTPADLLGLEIVRFSQGIDLQHKVPEVCQRIVEGRRRLIVGRSGCGICGADSIDAVFRNVRPVNAWPRVTASAINRAVDGIGAGQRLNEAAGSVHAAGWARLDGTIDLVREDVGRHNALDKLVGACVRQGVQPGQGFVVVTSRASFEMVQKVSMLGAGLLVALSGPTALAVRLANATGIALVGFARRGRFTAYTHGNRIEGP